MYSKYRENPQVVLSSYRNSRIEIMLVTAKHHFHKPVWFLCWRQDESNVLETQQQVKKILLKHVCAMALGANEDSTEEEAAYLRHVVHLWFRKDLKEYFPGLYF